MNTINANTKIAAILKQHPDALEAIISISPKFNKLRNPLLRKLMASRTSISMASRIGGCTLNDFFDRLQPLGFQVDKTIAAEENQQTVSIPDFVKNASDQNTIELDVRPVLEAGNDPFNLILSKIKSMHAGQVLKLVNSFEPIPLIQLLGKQGFETYSETISENLVNTYFFKSTPAQAEPELKGTSENWDGLLKQFKSQLKTIDVRAMEMPLPMLTILDELENLPAGHALYVYHKRIPVYLLPELKERKFEFRIKEISDGEVHLLIFRA